MTIETATYLGHQALMTSMIVAGPLMLATLLTGTLVSLLQTVTQIQEVTLVFVPKILVVFLVVSLLGGFMLEQAVGFGVMQFESIGDAP